MTKKPLIDLDEDDLKRQAMGNISLYIPEGTMPQQTSVSPSTNPIQEKKRNRMYLFLTARKSLRNRLLKSHRNRRMITMYCFLFRTPVRRGVRPILTAGITT